MDTINTNNETPMNTLKRETRNIFRLSNLGIFTWIVLNILLIWTILSGGQYAWQPLGLAVLVYAVSILVALSPVGEWILRLQTGCKSIERKRWREERAMIQPLFDEVYARAKEQVPGLQDGIRLFVNHDAAPNAFATGRKTICITKGLLKLPPEQIKAVLAHEFGHLAHRDTYLLPGVIVGNFVVTALLIAIKVLVCVIAGIAKVDAIWNWSFTGINVGAGMQFMIASIGKVLALVGLTVFMWVWGKLGVLLVMRSSRGNEYEADRFSASCGYGKDLVEFLKVIEDNEEAPKGIFATIASSHPNTDDRIERLLDAE